MLAVFQATPSPAAIREIDIRSMTRDFNAHTTACRVSFERASAAGRVSWRHTRQA